MARIDWTPAVLITATVSLATVLLVWLLAPWGTGRRGTPGPTMPRRNTPAEVVVWAGELGPDLKGVLAPVWVDPRAAEEHDRGLNGHLGLEGERALAYCRLLVFNSADEARTLPLGEGVLRFETEAGGQSVPLRSLADMVRRGEVEVPGGLAFSLERHGTLSTSVEIPPGTVLKLVVPFDGRARLLDAQAVTTAKGQPFRRRRMARTAFQRLIEEPDEERVKDL